MKKRLSNVVFRVQTPKGKVIVVHANQLQDWTGEEEEGRLGVARDDGLGSNEKYCSLVLFRVLANELDCVQ